MKKIVIGTANFGMNYGIGHNQNKLIDSDIVDILKTAKKLGIDTIDTAIAYGNSRDSNHRWEVVEGNIYTGITFGILAALCQAIGLIMMKPILSMGADPIASASLRTAISFIFLAFTFFLNYEIFKPKTALTLKIVGQSIISGFLGMALGMSLLLIALQKADAGIVATLSSTSPIMILLLIWLITKKLPTLGAWIGTVLAIIGSGLIFIY